MKIEIKIVIDTAMKYTGKRENTNKLTIVHEPRQKCVTYYCFRYSNNINERLWKYRHISNIFVKSGVGNDEEYHDGTDFLLTKLKAGEINHKEFIEMVR